MQEFNLLNCEMSKTYLISKIELDEKIKGHLSNIMICKNEKIMVLHKSFNSSSLMVKVLGINYVLGKNICKGIYVYDA